MAIAFSIALGLGLSAACGFRVFVPLLALSAAAHAGQVSLAPGFAWIGTEAALLVFAVASVCEIAAYAFPVFDNFLDTLATPAAVIAGSLLTASVAFELAPLARWSLALIAGGGIAGLIQVATTATRAGSTAVTGGMGNLVVSKAEFIGSATLSFLAVFLPFAALGVTLVLIVYATVRILRRRQRLKHSVNS
ncbi:MAG: DUF4126 domain-containing protein [Opitutaceae bacterium]